MDDNFDLAVIGGGVNGAGIARDAAGRGAKVVLLEAGDLAGGTSSASTKLIHGGLRYLEHYEFALVRESLGERERLWAIAPHIIWPMRFVLPYVKGLRPVWMLRLGLWLYDHIGGRRRLPKTRTVALERHPAGAPLRESHVETRLAQLAHQIVGVQGREFRDPSGARVAQPVPHEGGPIGSTEPR